MVNSLTPPELLKMAIPYFRINTMNRIDCVHASGRVPASLSLSIPLSICDRETKRSEGFLKDYLIVCGD